MKFSSYKIIKQRTIKEATKNFFDNNKSEEERQAYVLAEVAVEYNMLERIFKNKPVKETRQVIRKRPGICYYFVDTGEPIIDRQLDRFELAADAMELIK